MIHAFDVSEKVTDLAKKYWKLAEVDKKIDLKIANANDSLDELLKEENNLNSYDFAFVDADKKNYHNYYEKLLLLLKKGGWIAFDNAFAGNGVIDKEKYPYFGSNIEVTHNLNL